MSSSPPSYWCHRCTTTVSLSPSSATCPHCNTGFIESLPSTASHRHRHDRSPFNPVIVLRDEIQNHHHLYYSDDSSVAGLRPVPPPVSDFLISSGFDRLLEQLSGIEVTAAFTRPENPPASKASIEALLTCHVGRETESNCAICTDVFEVGSEAKEMPCKHMYHSECIIPWLKIRNTCPVCRAALPGEEGVMTEEGETPVGLTIWRLPGGGYAVGRWRGGVERERELPAVYTEMENGFGEGPRRVSWGSRSGRTRRGGRVGRAFRGFVSFFGRFRGEGSSEVSIERSRSSGSVFGRRRIV